VDTIRPPIKNENPQRSPYLHFRETTTHVMHHARPFSVMTRSSGVQVQVWTRFRLLLTLKIHNFFHIHLLLPYRATEAYATPHLGPPPVMSHPTLRSRKLVIFWLHGIRPPLLSRRSDVSIFFRVFSNQEITTLRLHPPLLRTQRLLNSRFHSTIQGSLV
jgi:hypothetical protein